MFYSVAFLSLFVMFCFYFVIISLLIIFFITFAPETFLIISCTHYMKTNKQPITLRTKSLTGGRKSLYLDYYDYSTRDKAKSHRYEFLKLYLLPETSRENKAQNREIMRSAQAILNQRLIDRANGMAHIKTQSSPKILLSDWMERYAEIKRTYGQSQANATIVQ